ncbi:hypothetical protein BDY19DRAFT_323900 [Irpex rosettiformis]|uniref:Uncharacterized protein n=1 Tax=Irpex rosettiformis TaxID=378272 RepID=A0ACB8TYK6_9APHY|nr:hypothetical protein BDY19DRAFT_323900 [Irpex rosettiformis]
MKVLGEALARQLRAAARPLAESGWQSPAILICPYSGNTSDLAEPCPKQQPSLPLTFIFLLNFQSWYASGVGVSSTCLDTFQDLKLGKKHKYIVFSLSDDLKEIIVAKTSADSNYESFIADLPETECRWAVYDFEYDAEGGAGKRNKLIFVSWSPDDAKIKSKMLYASSRDALRRALVGITAEVQGTAYDEISYEAVFDKVKRLR